MRPKEEVLAWEERWTRPAGIAALAAVIFVIASMIVASRIGGSSGAERLVAVNQDTGSQIISGFLLAIGFVLLAAPLYFLFRAARERSSRVRRQLVGVVIIGPIFFAMAAVVLGFATVDAAESFVDKQVPALERDGVKLDSDKAEEESEDAFSESSLSGPGAGLQFAGLIGFVAGFLYTALWAMRTGLLTRFWGSLGMALAAVSVFAAASPLFFLFPILWFVYVGFLLLGSVPGGRPPAWQSGKAEAWPSPGEKAAEQLGVGGDDPDIPGRAASPSEGASQSEDSRPSEGEAFVGEDMPSKDTPSEGPPKKRKQRG